MNLAEELAGQKCKPLNADSAPLSEREIRELAPAIPGWQIKTDSIKKEYTFKDFEAAMDFVNKTAQVAQAENHHPDMCISYNKVTQTLTSHKIGGLSVNDFIMAAKIDKIRS